MINIAPIKNLKSGMRGDTLIEVMLSVSILGLVLVLSFTAAGRSLNAGTDAANRNKALAYAREQVELLRDAANSGEVGNYPNDGTAFCIDPTTDKQATPGANGFCQLSNQTPFGVAVKFNPANHTYNVTSQWQGRTELSTVVLYYQVPQGPIAAPPFSGGSGGGGGGSSGVAPKITIGANPNPVTSGSSSKVSWSASDASKCYPSDGPADWMADSDRQTSGSFDTSAINSETTYTISCDSNSGGPSTQASVAVAVASGPSVKLNATPGSIEYYQGTTLSWQVSGVTSCSASSNDGSWGGSISPKDGSVFLNHLSPGTKQYILTCSGPGGQKSSNALVFVNNNPGYCIDANFQNCTYFKSDISNLDDYGLNDKISSVLVPPGRREILYKDANFSGACYLAASNVASMSGTNVGNDELSSFHNSTGGGC